MTNKEWASELIPGQDEWVYDVLSHHLDSKDKRIKELREKINYIKSVIETSKRWCADQTNGLTEQQVCMSALKDIRRTLKD